VLKVDQLSLSRFADLHTMFQFPQQGNKKDGHGGVFSKNKITMDDLANIGADTVEMKRRRPKIHVWIFYR